MEVLYYYKINYINEEKALDNTNDSYTQETHDETEMDYNPFAVHYEELADYDYSDNIEYVYKGDDKLVILDKEINKKLVITKESIGDVKELLIINPKMKILNNYGYKIGDYVEINLSSTVYKIMSIDGVELINNCIYFFIDNVKVSIRSSTSIFRLLNDVVKGYDTYTDEYVTTLSFVGVNENNYFGYIYQVLFLLSIIDKDDDTLSMNQYLRNEINNYKLKNTYCEAFHFYAEGISLINKEISSLYFYKVLEYFFAIVRANEFEDCINCFNKNNNIESFIKNTSGIYNNKEDAQVMNLIINLKDELKEVLDNACKSNIINTMDHIEFARKLYIYRNSIVHGKDELKFDLKLPNVFIVNEVDIFWREALQYIAKTLLIKYCLIIK